MIAVVSSYLLFNLLLILGFLGLNLARGFSARSQLQAHYQILAAATGVTLLQALWPVRQVFEPMVRVWSGPGAASGPQAVERGVISIGPTVQIPTAGLSWVAEAVTVIVGLIGLAIAIYFLRNLYRLLQVLQRAVMLRRVGAVRIYVHSEVQVPFSFWLPGLSAVVLPISLAMNPQNFKTAIFHELQHHRHGDTRWLFAMFFVRGVCWLNPVVHLWSRWLNQLQEFACDEALIVRRKVKTTEYARCLVEVAQTAIEPKAEIPASATGFLLWQDRNLLKRRIHKMLSTTTLSERTGLLRIATAILLLAMTGTAYAFTGTIQDRRVTMAQAEAFAKKVPVDPEFPVVINNKVLKWINFYMGTPQGRKMMRDSLQRMQVYKPMIAQAIEDYGLPASLIAIPIVESAYQNLPPSKKPWHGAGLWMFIKSTALAYGLRVDAVVDERLNEELETDAAMRYLSANKHRFKDWTLSVLAYNMGENAVQKAMDKEGTRSGWELVQRGYENDHDYLPKVMAAIIVMYNAESLEDRPN